MKLNAAEKKWLRDLQSVLDACPSNRIGFYTIGDPFVAIYDRTKEEEICEIQNGSSKDFGAAVDAAGAEIEGRVVYLTFPCCVHSVAG